MLVSTTNTGAKKASCINVINRSGKRYAEIGDIITANIKESTPEAIVKKGEVVKAVIVRTRHPIAREDGSILNFNLPTQKVKMKVSDVGKIKVPSGTYSAYLLESIPKKYRVWFDTSKDSVPLRIDGAIAFGGAKMVLVDTP